MRKGITYFYGFNNNTDERVRIIKQAGFDSVITNADKKYAYQNGNFKHQIKLLKKYNLKPSSLHASYNRDELFNFFLDNKIGARIEKNLKKELKLAKKYGFSCLVVHFSGKPSQVGHQRLIRVLDYAQKVGVPIAAENLVDDSMIKYIMSFSHPYLGFCYDNGHRHCFNPKQNYLKLFGNRLLCLHLHDNMGDKDMHTLNRFGNTNWEEVAKLLAQCPLVSLDYELMPRNDLGGMTAKEVVDECFKQACELEHMIEKYKSQNATSKSINKKSNTTSLKMGRKKAAASQKL